MVNIAFIEKTTKGVLVQSQLDNPDDLQLALAAINEAFNFEVRRLKFSILQGEEYMPIKEEDILRHAEHVKMFSRHYHPQEANDEAVDSEEQRAELFKNAVYVNVQRFDKD